MKSTTKYSLLLALSIFLSKSLCAQDDRDIKVGFKIIPGFNWAKPKTNNILQDGSGIGFSFGVMTDVRLMDNYYFASEILVSSMSNSIKMKDTTVQTLPTSTSDKYNNLSYKYNLKYIEVPLTFKFRTKESNGMRYWGQFGLAPGFIIGSSVRTLASPVGSSKNFPTDEKYIPNDGQNDLYDFVGYTDNINVFRCAMVLGAGLEYNLSGNTSFYSGIRFNNGFTDFLDDNRAKAINNVVGLEIGLFF